MNNSLTKFIRYARAHGVRPALRTALRRMVDGRKAADSIFGTGDTGQIDVMAKYATFLGEPHGDPADLAQFSPKTMPQTMQWVIPNFGFGSGGHLNIFRFMNMLAVRGYPQRLVILPPYDWPDVAAARAALETWYAPLNAEIALGVAGFAPAAITFATGWQTAYWVAQHRASAEKFYFVQDFEPYFHAMSAEYFLAENTYKLGLKGITAGTWLSDKLSADYGMRCGAVSFSCEHDHYFPRARSGPDSGKPQPQFNILFYSRHVSRRRLFELGLAALARVCAAAPEVKVIFAGGDVSGFHVPFAHLNAGELSLAALPDLYARCDLALVLSGTNLSLLPLELAACKCPVVMNDSPSARWLLPDAAAYYAPLDPQGMAETILAAIRDEPDRKARAEAAYQIARASSWEAQADLLIALLAELQG